LTAATTGAAAASGTVIVAGASFVDPHFPTHPFSAIEGFDDGIFLGFGAHIHKGEATRTPGFPINGQANAADGTIFVEDTL
jgi:hypothetical protein